MLLVSVDVLDCCCCCESGWLLLPAESTLTALAEFDQAEARELGLIDPASVEAATVVVEKVAEVAGAVDEEGDLSNCKQRTNTFQHDST